MCPILISVLKHIIFFNFAPKSSDQMLNFQFLTVTADTHCAETAVLVPLVPFFTPVIEGTPSPCAGGGFQAERGNSANAGTEQGPGRGAAVGGGQA